MRLIRVATAIMVGLVLLAAVTPVAAEPLAQGCEGLVNADFEGSYSNRGAGEVTVADGWHPFWQDGPFQEDGYNRRPEYKPEDASRFGTRRVHSGNFSQKWFTTFSTHTGGIFQPVGGIPVGTKATFSAWVQVWSSQHHDPDTVVQPGNYRVSVGIDPTGGTDWRSPNIIWSEPRIEYNTWMNLSVSAVAKANTVTFYLRGQPEFRTQFNDSYWDDACLQLERPAPTNTPRPKPTNTPTITPTPTDTPTPPATETPTNTPLPPEASICIQVREDANANGATDPGEGLLAGATLKMAKLEGDVLGTYVTDGKTETYCFVTRDEGAYYLTELNPAGYESTSPDNWGVYVVPGVDMSFGFYDKLAPTPTSTFTSTPTSTDTPTPTPTDTPTLVPTDTPVPTNTVLPTYTPTLDLAPPPTEAPEPQTMGASLYNVSGIFVALIGLALMLGVRAKRARS